MDSTVRNAIETEVDSVLKDPELIKKALEFSDLDSTEENMRAYMMGLLTAKFWAIYAMDVKREPTDEEFAELMDLLSRRTKEIREVFTQYIRTSLGTQ
ncbi:MAG: hypothetical protein V3T58_04250 [Candidatus Hydrothermarchaeales archaeon]